MNLTVWIMRFGLINKERGKDDGLFNREQGKKEGMMMFNILSNVVTFSFFPIQKTEKELHT